jgi:hypothetical protein
MERSLRLIEEARQALQNPEGQSNAQNLAQVAKDVSQVRWMDGLIDGLMGDYCDCMFSHVFLHLLEH